MDCDRQLEQLEDELNNDLRNYALQIMGHPDQSTRENYNTEVPHQYLEENNVRPEYQLEEDLEVMEQNDFLEQRGIHYRLTEEGQELIEWLDWDKLAESAKAVQFERGDRKQELVV